MFIDYQQRLNNDLLTSYHDCIMPMMSPTLSTVPWSNHLFSVGSCREHLTTNIHRFTWKIHLLRWIFYGTPRWDPQMGPPECPCPSGTSASIETPCLEGFPCSMFALECIEYRVQGNLKPDMLCVTSKTIE